MNPTTKLSAKTKGQKHFQQKDQSIVSNAFFISNFKVILPAKDLLSNMFTASDAIQRQSDIFLPLIKPLYWLEMNLGAMVASLSASTLVITLN